MRKPGRSAFQNTDGQESAAVAQRLDWSSHPLGSPGAWPAELRTTLSMLFNNRQPCFLFWGERHWCFYNDGYLPILSAGKHPWAMGRPGAEVWAEIWPMLLPQIELVRREGRATWNEDQLLPVLKDGVLTPSYFTYSYSPVFQDDGTIGGTLVTCMETTGKVRTAEALRESEEQLRLALQAAQMGVYERELESGKINWSEQAKRLLGVEGDPREESFGAFLGRMPPEDRVRFEAEAMTAAREGRSVDISYRYRRPDGELRWLHAYGKGVKNDEGRTVRAVGVLQDVTARKRDQEAHAESESRFRRIADGMPQIVWTADPRGGTTFINARWYEYTGQVPPENPAADRTAFIHPDDRPAAHDEWLKALAAQAGWEVELRLRHRSGAYRWHVSRAVPAFDPNGKLAGWYGTSTDIQAQKEAESRLQEAVRARDEFLSIASHELKTPLTSLKLQAQLMSRLLQRNDPKVFEPGHTRRLIDQTARQTDRLARLVDDMLDVARIETGKLTVTKSKVDLCELVCETCERLRPQFEEAHAPLEVNCCDGIEVELDAERMEQVVVNLLTNALRYGRKKAVRVDVGREGGVARFSVRDEGLGIAPEHQARVFDRFERAISPNEISGLGLGLYISRQIVETHGGRIGVESRLGEGSEFWVELPLQDFDKAARE